MIFFEFKFYTKKHISHDYGASGFMLNFKGIFKKFVDFIQDQNGKGN